MTANTKYDGTYEVTVTEVTDNRSTLLEKDIKFMQKESATGGTCDITVTVNNGVVTAKNDKTGS